MKRVFPVIKRADLNCSSGEYKGSPAFWTNTALIRKERLSRAEWARKLAELCDCAKLWFDEPEKWEVGLDAIDMLKTELLRVAKEDGRGRIIKEEDER